MINDNWTIRELGRGELAELTELETRCFETNPWGKAKLEASYRDRATTITVCVRGNSIIGFCIWRVFPPESEILLIGVRPTERNIGVAKAMIRNVIENSRRRSVKTLYLEVSNRNYPAITFYKASGFVESGVRRGYYRSGADALLMACKIQ
ncbi:MAG: ribosomal protein S18-alanine N-acetyltransferase [Marinicaulis sp.]|nr:ribosomal protein S18-alanine N-acetyltransferase [Marinicaulis sp.]